MRIPDLTSPGTGDQGEAVEFFRTTRENRAQFPHATARNAEE